MPLPRHIEAALEGTDCSSLQGTLAVQRECEGAKFHSPKPLMVHERTLAPSGAGETAWLCATCCDNLSVLQHLLVEHDGDLPWAVRREFGNLVRALALRGWKADHPEDEVASV